MSRAPVVLVAQKGLEHSRSNGVELAKALMTKVDAMTDRSETDRLLSDTGEDREPRLGSRPAQDEPFAFGSPYESRRIPPSGDVSPDGSRIWPQPSTTSKLLVWGGMGIAAAALTAGAVIAGRHVGEMIRGEDKPQPRAPRPNPARPDEVRMATLAPRYAELSPAERDALRNRNRQREYEEELRIARARAEAAERALEAERGRPRPSRRRRADFMREVERNTRHLSGSVDSAMGSFGAAFSGFRAVATQAAGLVSEFGTAAKLIRGMMGDVMASKDDRPAEKASEKAADQKDSAAKETDRREHRL
ncbi:hypothetical protein JCM7686_0722 [Paracoccus aminophilus JCM 7686]|uniref:Uncharacterized protein n=2 Tax=Paracoccus aminophilus TaxID=34003 RepID=S5YRD6_PARAH|nr:hypothetical protein JCM7686_0722 [Paracoccus aminophilus JCM 7686]